MTCENCAHCDTREATTTLRWRRAQKIAGVCARAGGWFNGELVPVWLTCPEYESIASALGRLKSGESHDSDISTQAS